MTIYFIVIIPAKRISAGSPRASQSSPSLKAAVNGRPPSYKGPATAVAYDIRPGIYITGNITSNF